MIISLRVGSAIAWKTSLLILNRKPFGFTNICNLLVPQNLFHKILTRGGRNAEAPLAGRLIKFMEGLCVQSFKTLWSVVLPNNKKLI